jgi:hypothetical protein
VSSLSCGQPNDDHIWSKYVGDCELNILLCFDWIYFASLLFRTKVPVKLSQPKSMIFVFTQI